MATDQDRMVRLGMELGSRYGLGLPRVVPGGALGTQLGRRHGESLEFQDYRSYEPGDDLRRLDWSAYARSDRLVMRVHREEISPHVDVLIDGSASMGVDDGQKAGAAVCLAALLATSAESQGMRCQVHLAEQFCKPLGQGRGAALGWEPISFDSSETLNRVLAARPPSWQRFGIRVVISDFLFPGDPTEVIRPLAHHAAQAYLLQVLHAEDREPPVGGNTLVVDSETGQLQRIMMDKQTVASYRRRLADHQQAWREQSRRYGVVFVTLDAEGFGGVPELSPLSACGLLEPA